MRSCSPTQARALSCQRPCFQSPTTRLRLQWAAVLPNGWPVSLQRPLGPSSPQHSPPAWKRRSNRRAMGAGSGRFWPTPNRASSQSSGPWGSGSWARRGMPSQSAWRKWSAVSGLCCSKGLQSCTGTPASCSSLATTRPSPPLWPGPTSTSTPRWGSPGVASSLWAKPRPAFSISAATGSPLVNSSCSNPLTTAAVTRRCWASAGGQAIGIAAVDPAVQAT